MAEKKLEDIARELRPIYRKGEEAAQRDNFDYAIAMFMQVLDTEPGCYEIRAALRAVQTAKAGKAGGFFKKAFNFAGSSPQLTKAKLAVRNNPLEAIAIAEQILNGDPHNSSAHKILAEAAVAAEMPHTAVLSFEALANGSPNDKALHVQFAKALAQIGENARAEKIMQDRLFANDKITVVWDSVVDEILGGDSNPPGVSGVKIKNVKTGATSTIPVDGVFVAIGHTPNTALFKEQITVDSEGYIVTKPGTTQTDLPGVFAAGDVQDKVFRQAVTAAGTGCMAAIEAERWLLTHAVSRASAAE